MGTGHEEFLSRDDVRLSCRRTRAAVERHSVGAFVAREIAGPFNADVFIGLDAALEPRVAETIKPSVAVDMAALNLPPEAIAALTNPAVEAERPNSRGWRAAEVPAANGHATALAARAALWRRREWRRARRPSDALARTIERMARVQTTRPDLMLGFAPNWAMGFATNRIGIYGPNPRAFGHRGGADRSAARTWRPRSASAM